MLKSINKKKLGEKRQRARGGRKTEGRDMERETKGKRQSERVKETEERRQRGKIED